MSTAALTRGSLLLSILPVGVLRDDDIQDEDHPIRTVLLTAVDTPRFVFFPHSGAVASIVRSTSTGQTVEAGIIGGEGVLNAHTVLGSPGPTGTTAVVQGAGRFSRMPVVRLHHFMETQTSFRSAVLGYVSVFLDQVTQNLVCNRLHSIEQRLAKWLLLMRDRMISNDLHLTQEFLSYMLGVHRPGVSIAVNLLEDDGLIKHRRNWITILDGETLAARSCECYRPLRDRLTDFQRKTFATVQMA